MRQSAANGYETSQLIWAVQMPHLKKGSRPPSLPEILKRKHVDA